MPDVAEQTIRWMGEFGREYTDRNALPLDELERLYEARYGVTRTGLNQLFLQGIDPSISVLELGSNVGDLLRLLQEMGFKKLSGIEVRGCATRLSKTRSRNIDIIQATVFNIPCRAKSFDLVFTSGLLIHVGPSNIVRAMTEIHRCSREYIWGFEYYAAKCTEITYREHKDLLWKADFAKLYLDIFNDLELVREKRFEYLDNPSNLDSMFLLRKQSGEHHASRHGPTRSEPANDTLA